MPARAPAARDPEGGEPRRHPVAPAARPAGGAGRTRSRPVAALELLARAARARVVTADLGAAEPRFERRQGLPRRRRIADVARHPHPLELAHLVVVERQDELDRLRLSDGPRWGAGPAPP